MANKTHLIDTSNELLLQHIGHGVQLIRPEPNQAYPSIGKLLNLPMNIYFTNRNTVTEKCNEVCAYFCGFDSVKDATGKSLYEVPGLKKEYADLCYQNNEDIIKANRIKIIEEEMIIDDKFGQALSIKLPWYDNNKVVGVFGFSIILGYQSLAQSLNEIVQLGLLSPQHDFNGLLLSRNLPGDIYLTKRESQCLSLTLRGKTARHIAKILSLSPRTVEQYLMSLKDKFQVKTKSELIDKAMVLVHDDM